MKNSLKYVLVTNNGSLRVSLNKEEDIKNICSGIATLRPLMNGPKGLICHILKSGYSVFGLIENKPFYCDINLISIDSQADIIYGKVYLQDYGLPLKELLVLIRTTEFFNSMITLLEGKNKVIKNIQIEFYRKGNVVYVRKVQ